MIVISSYQTPQMLITQDREKTMKPFQKSRQ